MIIRFIPFSLQCFILDTNFLCVFVNRTCCLARHRSHHRKEYLYTSVQLNSSLRYDIHR
jgi:hypothetical protein